MKTAARPSRIDQRETVDRAIRNPGMIPKILTGLEAESPPIKYGASKALRLISERAPAILYPQFDVLVEQLRGENTILKWNAIFMIGNLAAVDGESRIEGIFDTFFAPIPGPVMITASNTIRAAASIAIAKPELADRIAGELLKVGRAKYQTAECRQIVIGHAIEALDRFFPQIRRPKPVVAFVKKHLASTRAATRKKAERFLRRRARPIAK
jgi:hypothetical protein